MILGNTNRVGIIPFDIKDDDIAMLFITSQTRGRWILPKGKQEKNETPFDTCHREGFEEAGVRGIVLERFPLTIVVTKQMDKKTGRLPVTYYPFLVTEQTDDWPEKDKRQRHWSLLEEAQRIAYREDFVPLLQRFEELRPWIISSAKAYKEQQQAQPMPAQ